MRNIFEKLLVEQANRLSGMNEVTREDLLLITEADVLTARSNDTQLAKAEAEREEMKQHTQEAIESLKELESQLRQTEQ